MPSLILHPPLCPCTEIIVAMTERKKERKKETNKERKKETNKERKKERKKQRNK